MDRNKLFLLERSLFFQLTSGEDSLPAGSVLIGTQIWKIRNVDDNIPGSRVYDDNEDNRPIYGGLYTWNQIPDIEALYPGWHVPTDAEFTILTDYIGGLTGTSGKLKEIGITHWVEDPGGVTNETGFTALPGGSWNAALLYQHLTVYGKFWSSTADDLNNSWLYQIYAYNSNILRSSVGKPNFNSIRLIKS
jgi:uncharacterized protein (TIGR02145 family)